MLLRTSRLPVLAALLLTACSQRAPQDSPAARASSTGADHAPTASAAPTASGPTEAAGSTPAASAPAASVQASPRGVSSAFASVPVTHTYREKRLSWRQLDTVNWQPMADGLPALPPEPAADGRGCPAGMLRVSGGFLVDRAQRDDTDEVMFAQNQACTFWRTEDRGVNGLCDRFDREKWLAVAKNLPRKPLDFCMDRYEYPNEYGAFPVVVVTFSEGEKYCSREGKRLCTESEWTLACEGEEGLPYPYGYERDTTACNIGVLGPGPGEDTFKPRTTERTAFGSDLSWRGKRAGESPRCVSPYGISDLTGNVDEWTRTVRRYGYKMIMKGGHWGPARQRCRPQTRGHGPYYVRYDQGFRCCQDAPAAAPAAR